MLAFLSLRSEHHTKIHSTNSAGAVNKEIKRRINVVGILPNEAASVRLVGAILIEQNDEWAVARRYLKPSPRRSVTEWFNLHRSASRSYTTPGDTTAIGRNRVPAEQPLANTVRIDIFG